MGLRFALAWVTLAVLFGTMSSIGIVYRIACQHGKIIFAQLVKQ